MRVYCTLFDKNYLGRGLALQRSLLSRCPDSTLVVLGLDQETIDALSALDLPRVELVSLQALESLDGELKRIRSQRLAVEYYFTCKPALMRYVLASFPAALRITYLDADLYFFADPAPVESECAHSAIALSPHRFPPRLQDRVRYGRFNAGWVSVDCGEEGRRFIDWWRARCIEWCRLEVQEERFADQKYLDRVPTLFARVSILEHAGANLAPWNLEGLDIRQTEDGVVVAGKPLIFFHFHGLRRVLYRIYDSGLYGYGVDLSPQVRRCIYRPYFSELALAENRVSQLSAEVRSSLAADRSVPGLRQSLGRVRQAFRLIASGTAIVGP